MTALEYFEKGQELRKNKMFGEAINAYRAAAASEDCPEDIKKNISRIGRVDAGDKRFCKRRPYESIGSTFLFGLVVPDIRNGSGQSG